MSLMHARVTEGRGFVERVLPNRCHGDKMGRRWKMRSEECRGEGEEWKLNCRNGERPSLGRRFHDSWQALLIGLAKLLTCLQLVLSTCLQLPRGGQRL